MRHRGLNNKIRSAFISFWMYCAFTRLWVFLSFCLLLHNLCACAWLTSNLMVLKLVSAKGSHTGFNASCSQGNKDQTQHGQRSEGKTQHRHNVNTYVYLCTCCAAVKLIWVCSTHTCKAMLSGVPSLFVSVMSWIALTARTTCPTV